jgi:hypothetical protein
VNDCSRQADSQGTSTVIRGDDLKAMLSSVSTEPAFGAPDSFRFRFVKDALAICFHRAQEVEHNAGKLVGRGCNRPGPAELARDASEQLAKIVLSAHAGAVATRLRTPRLLVKSTLPPLIFFSGQSPSQDANAEAFRNRETSVSISHKMVWAVIAPIPGTFVRSTPKMRNSSPRRSNVFGSYRRL